MRHGSRPGTAIGLLIVAALGWAWIVPMARDMYGPMTGTSAWMMTSTWDARHLFLLWLMWAVMMASMMIPSAMPFVLLYDGFTRTKYSPRRAMLQVWTLVAGYLLIWALFSVTAVILQRLLSEARVLTMMMEMSSRRAIGLTLLLAGAYQFTPWKDLCLRQCRTPLFLVMQRWRAGVRGALQVGIEHGLHCLGCCWALMLLLFAGGVMNLAVIIGLTILVLIEKVSPFGQRATRPIGAAMLVAAAWLLWR
jgi:predicted metal-binding membrane protein